MRDHHKAGEQPTNVADIGLTRRSGMDHTLRIDRFARLMVCLAVIIFLYVLPAAAAELPVGDDAFATGRQDATSENKSTPSGKAAIPSPANNKGAAQAPSSKKQQRGTPAASKTPYGYAPSAAADQSKYRKALKLERDVGQNMRSIDNAIRQMNTDINRIRTLERRF